MKDTAKMFNEMQEDFFKLKKQLNTLHNNIVMMATKMMNETRQPASPKFEMEGEFRIVLTKNERDGTYRIDSSMTQEKALALKNENIFLHNTTECDPESDGPCHFPNTHHFIHELMKLSTELDTR